MSAFDQHPHIRYQNLSRLYWGEFAYRVTIEVPAAKQRRCRDANALVRVRDRILDEVKGFTPGCEKPIGAGYNFFFREEDEARTFIDLNADRVSVVVRPAHKDDIETLMDPKVRFRDSLYWGEYEWSVTLQGSTWNENRMKPEEIDSLVRETYFDEGDYRYPHGAGVRGWWQNERARFYQTSKINEFRLYLRDMTDVVLLKLCMEEQNIAVVEQAVVRVAELDA